MVEWEALVLWTAGRFYEEEVVDGSREGEELRRLKLGGSAGGL